MNGALAALWILLVLALAGLTIPSILTLQNTVTWASSWAVVGAMGVYVFMRSGKRKRE